MYYYLIQFLLLILFELFYFRIADRCNIVDKPNERSSHSHITLCGGGIVFYLGVLSYFLSNQFSYPWFFVGLTWVSIISFMDDVRPVSQGIRLFFHFTGILILFFQWGLPGGASGNWWLVLIAWIVCVGIINAYNFMDGINGITGGYSLVVLLSLAYINQGVTAFVDERLIYILILSALIFNFFNFRKQAICFAGDVGAVSIAFALIFLLGQLMLATKDFSCIVLLAVYGVDSILTIIHRLILKEKIWISHRKHMYQLMANELKIPHTIVSTIYMVVQATVAAGYIVLQPLGYGYFYLLGVLLLLAGIYAGFMKKFFRLHVDRN